MPQPTNPLVDYKTNSLVAKARRFAAPTGGALAILLGAVLFLNHACVHAAVAAPAAGPLEDNSVSSLVALDNAVEAVAARVSPAVVNVAVTSKSTDTGAQQQGFDSQDLPPGFAQFFGPMQRQQQQPQIEHGVGSGVIISPDGYIVTNNHVVDGAVEMKVTLDDRRVMTAKLVGVDKLTDLAVIKVDGHDLPSIPWGDSSTLRPGQTVLAFGSPFGYFQDSVTRGIVSAVNRQNPYSDDPRKPGGFIQTDAAINPGNSGGALVNAHGELVGINTFIISNSGSFAGAGFAIPSALAKNTVDQIIKTGAVHHGYVGIAMNDVTPENASFFHLHDASGAIVSQVTPDSPASRAGLERGDVITALNGKKIPNGSALQLAVSQIAPGTDVTFGILRDGTSKSIDLKVGEYHGSHEVADNDNGNASGGAKLGLAVDDLNNQVRHDHNIPDSVHGAVVEQVRPASPAEDAGLAPGDVVVEVNRKPVSSASQFVDMVHANSDGKDMLLTVWSHGNESYRVIHPQNG